MGTDGVWRTSGWDVAGETGEGWVVMGLERPAEESASHCGRWGRTVCRTRDLVQENKGQPLPREPTVKVAKGPGPRARGGGRNPLPVAPTASAQGPDEREAYLAWKSGRLPRGGGRWPGTGRDFLPAAAPGVTPAGQSLLQPPHPRLFLSPCLNPGQVSSCHTPASVRTLYPLAHFSL